METSDGQEREPGSRGDLRPDLQSILAALNIADEHFQRRGAEEELRQGMTQRLGRLVDMLDRAMPGRKETEKGARRDAGAESP
jgi:hypothetical protein